MKKSTSAFTLIELMTVIAILLILVIVSVALYNGTQARARDADRRVDVANLTKALEQYYSDNGSYPVPSGGWYYSNNANWATLGTALNGDIDSMPTDPKNNGDPTLAANYGYSYYYTSAAGCGHTAGQWYMIVYRFESSTKTSFTDGSCSTNDGATYYNNGANYYISAK